MALRAHLLVFSCCISLTLAQNTGRFVWFSDVDIDADYKSNCRAAASEHDLGRFGTRGCDSPPSLVGIAMKEIAETLQLPDPDFIVFTGGTARSKTSKTIKDIDMSFEILADTILESFPGVPFFPVIGASDYISDEHISWIPNALYNKVAVKHWGPWLSAESKDTVNDHGYYSQDISKDITLIALNTNFYLRSNKNATMKGVFKKDIGGQFYFLAGKLLQARKQKRKVIIIGHSAMGRFERKLPESAEHRYRFWDVFNTRLIDIFQRFSDVIACTMFGGTHTDSFRLIRNVTKKSADVVLLTAPSIAPQTPDGLPTEPRFRIVKYDRTTGRLLDYDQYSLNMNLSNRDHAMMWRREYSSMHAFAVTPLTPQRMGVFYKEIATPDSAFYRHYCTLTTGLHGDEAKRAGCFGNENAKEYRLCSMVHLKDAAFSDCLTSFPWMWLIGFFVLAVVTVILGYLTRRKVLMNRKRLHYVAH